MDNSVKCGNCRFCYTGNLYAHQCRKHAAKGDESTSVGKNHWCGEFKRKLIHEEGNRNLEPQKLVAKICGNCIHFRTEGGIAVSKIESGSCAYNPPSMLNSNISMFPKVNKISSCSKFRSREIVIEEPQNVLTSGKRAITLGDS